MIKLEVIKFVSISITLASTSLVLSNPRALGSSLTPQNLPVCLIELGMIEIPINEVFCSVNITGTQGGLEYDYQLTATSTKSKAVISIDPFEFRNISGGQNSFNFTFPSLAYDFPPAPVPPKINGSIGVKIDGRFIGNPGNEVIEMPDGQTNVQAKGTTTALSSTPNMVMAQDGHLEADAATVFSEISKREPAIIDGGGILTGTIELINMPTGSRFVSSGNTLVYEVQVPEPTSTLSFLSLGILGAGVTLKRKLKPSNSVEKETTKVG
jgi:hypothetical protein